MVRPVPVIGIQSQYLGPGQHNFSIDRQEVDWPWPKY